MNVTEGSKSSSNQPLEGNGEVKRVVNGVVNGEVKGEVRGKVNGLVDGLLSPLEQFISKNRFGVKRTDVVSTAKTLVKNRNNKPILQ